MANNKDGRATYYAGLKWDDAPKKTWLTTKQITEFLQTGLDLTVEKLKREDPKWKDLKSVQVTVASTQVSDRWIPIFIILPAASVLESSNDDGSDKLLAAFRPSYDDDEAELKMLEPFAKYFGYFSYNKYEIKELENPEVQKQLGIKKNEVNTIIRYMKPRYRTKKYDAMDAPYVMVVADPIKIFKEMMKSPDMNDDKNFEARVTEVQKIRHGEYRYHVTKSMNKKKNDGYSSFYKDMDSFFTRR